TWYMHLPFADGVTRCVPITVMPFPRSAPGGQTPASWRRQLGASQRMIDHVSTSSPSLRNMRSNNLAGTTLERVRVTVTDVSVLSMSISQSNVDGSPSTP